MSEVSLRDSLQVQAPDEAVDWLNFLIYGDPGVGKTFLGGTAADHEITSPVLVLDVEGGVTTIRHKPVDVVQVRSIAKVEEIYNKLYHSIEIINGVQRIHYRTVFIDSATELADLDMRLIMREAYQKNPDKVDVDVPSPREWGKNRIHMRKIVRAFRDLPCHVIFTASVATLQEEGQPTKYFPGFAGKLKTEIPGFVDVVGFLSSELDPITGVIDRRLQVAGTRRVVAKDRTSNLGDVIVNPTIPGMWDRILNPSAANSVSSDETSPSTEESIEATAA